MLKRLDISAYKKLYDKSPMAVAIVSLIKNKNGVDVDFLYEYTNQAMADVDQLKASDLIGKKYSEIYKKYPPEATMKNLVDSAYNDVAGTSQEYWSEAGISVSMQYAPVGHGCVAVYVVELSNVDQLRAQNERLVNRIPGGIVIIEVTDMLHFFHCNDWYHNALGYTKEEFEELCANDPNSGIHPDDIHILKDSVEECFYGKNSCSCKSACKRSYK